jgi:hypothetical protein
MQPNLVANAAAGLGTFIGIHSLYAVLNPNGALALLGFPSDPTPNGRVTRGVIRMFAATRAAVAISQIAAWYYGAHRVLGWHMVASVFMATVDG